MIIENSDALMAWLAAVLEPLCDADPNALSKYVVALIKKDKPEPELKDSMEQQMEVFLQENTVSFIESLFKALESKEYLEGPPKTMKKTEAEADLEEDGKPDSTTSTPANIGELSSDLKDAEHRSTRRTSDEDRGRRRSPKERKLSSPRRRRSSGHRGRHRSRSRSPYGRRSGRRGTSPFSSGRSRSRSFSPRRVGSRSPPRRYASRGSTPTNDEDNNTYTPSAVSTTPIKKQRCRDYDEKGFCLKGDQCKFDHGNDAVVLEDTNNPSINSSTYMPGMADPYVPASTVLPPLHLPPPGYPATHASHSRKRSYEDTGASGGGSYPPNKRFDYNRLGGRGRGGRGRGGRSRGYGGSENGSSHVLVKNIPPGLNTIANLNNHFAKFGTLVNVQIHYQGDHSAALVSYAQPQEASAAMNSSEAVFGNRFIKMFFNNPDRGLSVKDRLGESTNERVSADGKTITKTIINSEAGVAAGKDSSTEQPSASAESLEEANAIKENKKAAAIAAIKKNQEVLEMKAKLRKEADVKKVEAVKKTEELRKSKQQLLEKLIDEQKKLILKLEEKKGCFKAEEKTAMMTLLKSLTSSIEKTKEDIKALISQQSVHPRKNISDIQKELLDAELELFNAQQDGNEEVEDIQKKVNRLKVEAAQKGLLPTSRPPRGRGFAALRGMRGYHRGSPFSPRGRGRGGFRGRGGRGSSTFSAFPVQTSIDRRPTTILVSEIDLQLKDAIVAHLTKFGEISESIEDEESKTLLVQFKTRREAETAMLKAKVMGDSELSLSWHSVSIGESSFDVEQEEAEQSGIEEQSDLLDDYTPLDPTYLPPGLEEDGNKDSNAEPSKPEDEEEEEEEDDAERSWKR